MSHLGQQQPQLCLGGGGGRRCASTRCKLVQDLLRCVQKALPLQRCCAPQCHVSAQLSHRLRVSRLQPTNQRTSVSLSKHRQPDGRVNSFSCKPTYVHAKRSHVGISAHQFLAYSMQACRTGATQYCAECTAHWHGRLMSAETS